MSFTTRCPACGTMFRVVADQLKISEGWVRCGHCADVFDATLYLQPWTPPDSAGPQSEGLEEERAPEPPEYDPDDDGPETAIMEDSDMVGEWAELEGTRARYEPEEEAEADADASVWPEVHEEVAASGSTDDDAGEVSDFHTDLQRFAASVGRTSEEAPDATVQAQAAADTVDEGAPVPLRADPISVFADSESGDPKAVPGFVRQARRRAFWQSPGVRVLFSLLALLLGALLVAQWAVHERDRLAAARPDLQPWLQRACDVLGCKLGPVRRIDAVVIDSTALVRRLGDFYSFDLVLKNTAALPLAMPALELSLTDTRDQVIARRVFLPEEWPDAPTLLPAQSSVSVSFRLALALGEAMPMAGYRALVFYP